MVKALIELKPRLIVRGERAMGPGKADLLEQIDQAGSISAAAKRMSMSYSRAWQLVDAMNRAFREPLVAAATGGARGGGASITPNGRRVLRLYRNMQRRLQTEAGRKRAAFEALLK
jgi:molybdate transport system regulatory protein